MLNSEVCITPVQSCLQLLWNAHEVLFLFPAVLWRIYKKSNNFGLSSGANTKKRRKQIHLVWMELKDAEVNSCTVKEWIKPATRQRACWNASLHRCVWKNAGESATVFHQPGQDESGATFYTSAVILRTAALANTHTETAHFLCCGPPAASESSSISELKGSCFSVFLFFNTMHHLCRKALCCLATGSALCLSPLRQMLHMKMVVE